MYRIGMFSKLGKVTVKTLRHYDETGLLVPAFVDTENGYRYYTTGQLFRLGEIMALRQMGFSIPEISALVDGHHPGGILEQRKAELECEKQNVALRLARLNHYMQEQKEGKGMNYQAVIKEIPACTVFSVRRVVPNYAALGEIMPTVGAQVAATNPGIRCVEPDYCFNIYHDKEFKEENADVEICQAVTTRGKDSDGVVFKDLPAVTVVSVLHKGAYSKLGQAYAYAVKWVEENGYHIIDNLRESYIDGVWNKDSEDEWLTEIQVPVEKK